MEEFTPTRNPFGQSLGADDIQLQRPATEKVDVFGLFAKSFETVKQHPTETVGGGLLAMGAVFVGQITLAVLPRQVGWWATAVVSSILNESTGAAISEAIFVVTYLIALTVFFVVVAVAAGGYHIVWLRLVRGEDATIRSMDDVQPFVFRLVVLWGLVLGFGMLFLAPGILLALVLALAPFVIVDKNLLTAESMKASFRMMDGHVSDMVVLGLAACVVNALGTLICGVGLMISFPVTVGAFAGFYNKLAVPGRAYAEDNDRMQAFE